MGCPQRRALRGGAAEDRDATKHHDGAEESARAKVTCAQRLRRAERRAAPSFDGAADGCRADQEDTLKGVALRAVRELRVLKSRGSEHISGQHSFEIARQGIVIYPRTEAILATPSAPPDVG